MSSGFRNPEDDALIKLHKWLSYEVKSGWGILLYLWVPVGIATMILYLLIAVFLPLIALQLFRAKWYGTLVFFVGMVFSTYFGPRALSLDPMLLHWLNSMFLFLIFFLFCWVLRWVVAEKVEKIKEIDALERMSTT